MRNVKSGLWLVLMGMLALCACNDIAVPTVFQVTPLPPTSTSTSTPEPPTPTPSPTPEPQAALVNGQPILLADYERQVARYEASMVAAGQDPTTPEGKEALAQGLDWVLDVMIDQVLIEQAALQAGIVVDDEKLETTIQSLEDEIGKEAFNTWLADEGMSLEEMRNWLRADMVATQMANQVADNVPTHVEHVHARHILASTEEEARQILGQVQAGADFITLARTYSQDVSTRDAGGDLGFFPLGVLTSAEVAEAAFALQPGQVSDVIHSDLGYHIVQVVERTADMEITPDNLRLLRDKVVREWVEALRAAADIQRFVSSTAP
jgi:parvulin-like peptidyl-prolyl isomerase